MVIHKTFFIFFDLCYFNFPVELQAQENLTTYYNCFFLLQDFGIILMILRLFNFLINLPKNFRQTNNQLRKKK
ncbi:hypothetical protein pb186bvf_009692 [Paramecium bursaria]